MDLRLVKALAAAAALVAASLSAGCTPAVRAGAPLQVAGTVRVDETVVRGPSIAAPAPDLTAGIRRSAAQFRATVRPAAPGPTVPVRGAVVAGFLSEVLVHEGDRVRDGQTIARLDTTMLDLGVRQAQAGERRARADVEVIDARLDDLEERREEALARREELLETRRELRATRQELLATRAGLEATLAVLLEQRSSLEASITALEELVALPGGPPPHDPPYPVLLGQMRAALSQLDEGISAVRDGLTRIEGGLRDIASGLSRIQDGLRRLRSGLSQIENARTTLRGVRNVAEAGADMARVAVEHAEATRDRAVILSPVDGLVTYSRPAGTAVMVGAPIVRIVRSGRRRIHTYLTPDQLRLVRVGAVASVDYDSNVGGVLRGTVTEIDDRAVVPPTPFPTALIHMTRAVRVTIELEDGASPPPGTPVDVEIRTSR